MSNIEQIAQTLNALEIKTLLALAGKSTASDEELLQATKIGPDQMRTAIELLKSRNALEAVDEYSRDLVSLSELGAQYAREGTPEILVANELRSGASMDVAALRKLLDGRGVQEVGSAIGALKEAGIINLTGGSASLDSSKFETSKFPAFFSLLKKIAEAGTLLVQNLPEEEQALIKEGFKKRGKSKSAFTIKTEKRSSFRITAQGRELAAALRASGLTGSEASQLTPQMLSNGSWRDLKFRQYNLSLKPTRVLVGKLNAYRQFLDFLQGKLVAMGFEEMRGSFVEPEFWNMDALFMPQFHSAREIHDNYFIKEPKYAKEIESEALRKVAAAHENGGGTGSKGWRYKFDTQKTKRLILRSQGTVLSARWLASNPKVPGKYFAIARCFRYDQVDSSHAPDFFQVEGIVLEKDVTFRTLLGLLRSFALEIARAKEIRFVPAYFPFTEPSVEVHMRHPKLGWMELGGAGIFRPELSLSLGVKQPVLAWGLGIDRMAMVALGINDIRDLFSRDLEFIRNSSATGILK
ncbi:MAG: phenylalanine--tRNA ligase subunit alpha [Deltaproteobacteria bacterium]|nr:phenylalanine--tRNA ligase subunit alpha [Deltaproteobacteria bacterium]